MKDVKQCTVLLLMLPVQLVLLFWIGTNALSADFLLCLLL